MGENNLGGFYKLDEEEQWQINKIIKKVLKHKTGSTRNDRWKVTLILLRWINHHYTNYPLSIPTNFPFRRKKKRTRLKKLKIFQDMFQPYYKNIKK